MRTEIAMVACLALTGAAGCVSHGKPLGAQHGHPHGHGHGHRTAGASAAECPTVGAAMADDFAAAALARVPEAHRSARHGRRFERAEACADPALQRSPNRLEARYVRGLAQLDRHEFRKALSSARAVLTQNPEHVGARLLASDAHLELGALGEAEREISAALASKPTTAGLVRAAHLRRRFKDPVGAQDLYRRALLWAVRGGDRGMAVWAAVELANVLMEGGDLAGAEAGIAWARAHEPQVFEARFLARHTP